MNTRMNRSAFQIGTYCLRPYARTEKHVRELAECGIDFLVSVDRDEKLLDLLSRYHMGAVVNGIVPGWFGGKGENAGKMAEKNPLSAYEAGAEKFADHPAIWGIDVGDEPSSLDFPHYGKVMSLVNRSFKNQFAYLNLYAGYGMLASASLEQAAAELGTIEYEKYLRSYCQQVESDYLCFDHYVFSSDYCRLLKDLATASTVAGEYNRDLWMVLQVNSLDPKVYLGLDQLYLQAYTAMAYGVRCISWACYTAGWWHNHVLDQNGEKTEQYEKLKRVNGSVKSLSPYYMRYRQKETRHLKAGSGLAEWGKFREFEVVKGESLLAGLMCNERETDEKALFLAAGADDGVVFRLRTEQPVVFRTGEETLVRMPDGDGWCEFELPASRGGLLTCND